MFIQHLKCVTVSVWFGSNLPEVVKIFSQINISVVFTESRGHSRTSWLYIDNDYEWFQSEIRVM
jgi:hypothetical protein